MCDDLNNKCFASPPPAAATAAAAGDGRKTDRNGFSNPPHQSRPSGERLDSPCCTALASVRAVGIRDVPKLISTKYSRLCFRDLSSTPRQHYPLYIAEGARRRRWRPRGGGGRSGERARPPAHAPRRQTARHKKGHGTVSGINRKQLRTT